MKTWDERLREAFDETGWSKATLAKRSGVPYDNVLKYLAGKVKQPRGEQLDQLAEALGLDPLMLFRGVSSGDVSSAEVNVVGYLGAGAEVEPDYEQVPPEGFEQINLPFPLPDEMIAFRVRGISMLPVYKPDTVIVVYREQKKPLESFYGEEAAVRTADGRRFIKTIERGARGVNLRSWNDHIPIENVTLEWIGEIFAVLPPAAIKKVERQGGIQGRLSFKRTA
ncbi:MAG TPA: XRE family transcriptional regulator [Rhizobiaceae bacterium]|nr:XRE family transcriptional regulator [Rhizobiaceae bacterium]